MLYPVGKGMAADRYPLAVGRAMASVTMRIPAGWADGLAGCGFAIEEAFYTPQEVSELREDLLRVKRAGLFRPAGIGRGAVFQLSAEIRSDEIYWWDKGRLPRVQQHLHDRLEDYRLMLNREFFLGLQGFDIHYACYEPGRFYRKHLDSFRRGNRRVVSFVSYLNEDWSEADGGELRIYAPEDEFEPVGGRPVAQVLPRAGTAVTFMSDQVPHEVLPARRARYSVTGWFYRS